MNLVRDDAGKGVCTGKEEVKLKQGLNKKKVKYIKREDLNMIIYKASNSMAYGTRRFNAAFRRALQ